MRSQLPAEPALVGREVEIQLLRTHLESALNWVGNTVLICGEAGVGKTKLVTEFLSLEKESRIQILKGWCLGEGAPAYFPFTEAINSYLLAIGSDQARSEIMRHPNLVELLQGSGFTRELGEPELSMTPKMRRDMTFETFARVFLQWASQEPIILFLDDLHWADHLTLALLHYVSRKCRKSQLLIIGTYRPEEVLPLGEDRLHPLQQIIHGMKREDLLVEIRLNRLTRADFPILLKSIFHSSIADQLAEKLHEETEGNPLFALETLNMLVDNGLILEREGQWELAAPIEKLQIPSKVHEVIAQRIARLRLEERKLLDLAAVCGHSFSPHDLSEILELDIADVLRTLAEIEHRHRIVRTSDSRFEFTHQKIRDVMYEILPNELRRVYHLKAAKHLERALAEQASGGSLADITLHYVAAGAPEKAFEYLIERGKQDVNIYANMQAIENLSKALDAIEKNVKLATNANLLKIHQLRGIAWLHQENPPHVRARSDFTLMLQMATKKKDPSAIAEAHFLLGRTFDPYHGESDRAKHHFEAALEIAQKTSNRHLEARSSLFIGSALIAVLATMEEGRTWLEKALQVCRQIGDKVNEASAYQHLGWYFNWKGEFAPAKENLLRAAKLLEESAVPDFWLANTLFMLTITLAGNGEYNEAISTGEKCLRIASDSGLWVQATWMLNTLGWIHQDLANIDLATKYNIDAIDLAKTHGKDIAWGGVPHALLNLAEIRLSKGDNENAEKYFNEAVNKGRKQHPVGWWRIESRVLLGRGEIRLSQGDYAQALKLAEDSLAISQKADAKKYIAKGLKLRAEALAAMGNVAEAIGELHKALELAQNVKYPPLLWQIHHRLGSLLERRGDAQKAKEQYVDALALIETTAAKLDDTSLRNSLLTAPLTKAIRAACSFADRIPTGNASLDGLLLGGIPRNYAVIITSPSCDERDAIIHRFLSVGAEAEQTTFYLTTSTSGVANLAKSLQTNSCVLLVDPQAERTMKDVPHVVTLRGIENLNEINIALTSALRNMTDSSERPRRACIELVSDVLLQHHALQTRRWLSALVSELKSKGFTTIAVMNPQMHPTQEAQAVLDLFEGEICIFEKHTDQKAHKFAKVVKMLGQRYLENETLIRDRD